MFRLIFYLFYFKGDSGGPLFISNTENRWTVVGIVSYGKGCAIQGVPGYLLK